MREGLWYTGNVIGFLKTGFAESILSNKKVVVEGLRENTFIVAFWQ